MDAVPTEDQTRNDAVANVPADEPQVSTLMDEQMVEQAALGIRTAPHPFILTIADDDESFKPEQRDQLYADVRQRSVSDSAVISCIIAEENDGSNDQDKSNADNLGPTDSKNSQRKHSAPAGSIANDVDQVQSISVPAVVYGGQSAPCTPNDHQVMALRAYQFPPVRRHSQIRMQRTRRRERDNRDVPKLTPSPRRPSILDVAYVCI